MTLLRCAEFFVPLLHLTIDGLLPALKETLLGGTSMHVLDKNYLMSDPQDPYHPHLGACIECPDRNEPDLRLLEIGRSEDLALVNKQPLRSLRPRPVEARVAGWYHARSECI